MEGKSVLIVGGTGGLGSKLKDWISLLTKNICAVGKERLDVRDHFQCERFFEKFNFDVVINLSGVNHDGLVHKRDFDAFDDLIDVNVRGTVNLVSACLQRMRLKGYGRIILVSSVLSNRVVNGTAVYSSCKAFIDKFARNVTAENIGRGITVNSIQLGYFDGGMTYRIPEAQLDRLRGEIGLKRFGRIDELGKTIRFLVDNEYVAGANIRVDGFVR